jgi:hypothetical protein
MIKQASANNNAVTYGMPDELPASVIVVAGEPAIVAQLDRAVRTNSAQKYSTSHTRYTQKYPKKSSKLPNE